jgi:hypothetical protein
VSPTFFVTDHVRRVPAYVYDIKDPLEALRKAAIIDSPRAPAVSARPHKFVLALTCRAQWFMELTIQTSMLIEGIAKIIKARTASIEIQNRLKSKDVWVPALEYVCTFLTFLDLSRA